VIGSGWAGTNVCTVDTNSTAFLINPCFFIWAGGSELAYTDGMANVDLHQLSVLVSNVVPRNLSYRLSNAPSGASIDPNGVVNWTPGAAQAGTTNTFTTVVTDNGIPPLARTNTFVVVVNPWRPFLVGSVVATNNAVTVAWESLAGQTYRLQYKDRLDETDWQDAPPDLMASGTNTVVTNSMGSSPSRFYRVRLVP
jgi:hypothetical protein